MYNKYLIYARISAIFGQKSPKMIQKERERNIPATRVTGMMREDREWYYYSAGAFTVTVIRNVLGSLAWKSLCSLLASSIYLRYIDL